MHKESANVSEKKKISAGGKFLLVLVLIAAIAAGGFFWNRHRQKVALEEKQAEQLRLLDEVTQQALEAIAEGVPRKIAISDEAWTAMDEQGSGYIFYNIVVREAIADKFSQFYREEDLGGLVNFLALLNANYASGLMQEEETFDICFSESYLSDLKQYIRNHGTYLETNGENEIYSYGGSEFWLSSFVYIKYSYTLDGNQEEGSVILGGTDYRYSHHNTYSEDSKGYFLVDREPELVISQLTTSEKEPGNCSRCDGTGKVTSHFGKSWNTKEGYIYGEKCGLCNGTGWSH